MHPHTLQELLCSADRGEGGGRDTGACETRPGGASGDGSTPTASRESCDTITCECGHLTRRIAVFATQVLPKVRRQIGPDYSDEVRRTFDEVPPALPTILVAGFLLLLLAVHAWRAHSS
jgi:hypothetical protein